jgi:molybdenum cofactor biosynthesis enzyme MoaA
MTDRNAPLVDQFNRRITYLRLSVTDRCDLRCSYCMPERMTFLPRKEVLSLEELHQMALGFIDRGITKIRLTGGEPLVRRDMMELVRALGRKIGDGLEELTMTTNATGLPRPASAASTSRSIRWTATPSRSCRAAIRCRRCSTASRRRSRRGSRSRSTPWR